MIVSGCSKRGINGKEESGNVPEARPSISPRSCKSLRIFAAAAMLVSTPRLIHASSSDLQHGYIPFDTLFLRFAETSPAYTSYQSSSSPSLHPHLTYRIRTTTSKQASTTSAYLPLIVHQVPPAHLLSTQLGRRRTYFSLSALSSARVHTHTSTHPSTHPPLPCNHPSISISLPPSFPLSPPSKHYPNHSPKYPLTISTASSALTFATLSPPPPLSFSSAFFLGGILYVPTRRDVTLRNAISQRM